MLRDWSEEAPDLWSADGFDGRWEIHRLNDRWVAIPPLGCSYPYAVVAPMMQAPCLASAKHAARDCMEVVYAREGLKELRKRGPATTPPTLHRLLFITSCGVTYAVKQQAKGSDWVAEWSAWDRSGEIHDPDLATLIGRLREAIPEVAEGYSREGFRAELLAEDQRIALRLWTLKKYSQATEVHTRLMADGMDTAVEQAIPAMIWSGRAEAYSLSLGQQDAAEAALFLHRGNDKDHYPGLSF